jgi:hypothetical protein
MGAIIWTCLALTLHQGPVKERYFNQQLLSFPITITNSHARIKKFVLLVSEDEGQNWQQADSRDPSEKALVYRAKRDGRYWFILQEVDLSNGERPADPKRVRPHQIICIDTVPPRIQVKAERLPDGRIRASWKIVEQVPELRSMVLEYHTRATHVDQWTPLPIISPALEGQHEFDPGRDGHTGEVSVRIRMKDQAGNASQGVAVLPASSSGTGISPAIAAPSKSPDSPAIGLIPSASTNPSNVPGRLTSQQTSRPPVDPTPMPFPGGGMPLKPPPASTDANRSGGVMPALAGSSIAASTDRGFNPPPSVARETAVNTPGVKIVKTREVRLDFTVAKVGPSGLGNADVYVTLDKGASWKKLPGDSPITLPPNVELRGPDPISGSVGVQLPLEGTVYGFIVAVKSKAGLAPPPPNPGDAPEILVELDTTAPRAQLFKPIADPSQPNTLVMSWSVTDRNLSDNPITLEWSEQANGPWSAIGGGPLSNSGQYAWHLPPQVPSRVYLRLTARDLAGNEGRAQTREPELIDLSIPQTKITGVAPGK